MIFFLVLTSSPFKTPHNDASAVAARPVFIAVRRLILGILIMLLPSACEATEQRISALTLALLAVGTHMNSDSSISSHGAAHDKVIGSGQASPTAMLEIRVRVEAGSRSNDQKVKARPPRMLR